MHILYNTLFVVLCATFFSAPVQADDVASLVEQNFPYQEVDGSYGAAKIQQGQCREGTPFPISWKVFQPGAKMDVARQIHERVRSLGANAMVMTDLDESGLVGSVMVTPLTCDLS